MSHKDFIGCMRDLHIDGRRMDMAAFVANNGTMAGRPEASTSPAHGPVPIIGREQRTPWGDSTSDFNPVSLGGKHHATAQTLGPGSYQLHPSKENGAEILVSFSPSVH